MRLKMLAPLGLAVCVVAGALTVAGVTSSTTSGAAVTTLKVGEPYSPPVVFDPSSGRMFVGDPGGIEVLDEHTRRVLRQIPVPGEYVDGLAFDPATDVLYATSVPSWEPDFGAFLFSFNARTGAQLTALGTGMAGAGVVVDPATATVWVADTPAWVPPSIAYVYGTSSTTPATIDTAALAQLIEVNARTNTIMRSIESVDLFPLALAIDPTTNSVLVSQRGGEVEAFSGATGAHLWSHLTADAEPSSLAVNDAASTVVVTNPNVGTVATLSVATGKVLHSFTLGDSPIAAAIDPHTGRLVVVAAHQNAALEVNPTTGATIARVPVGSYPTLVAIDPTTGLVATSSAKYGTISLFHEGAR